MTFSFYNIDPEYSDFLRNTDERVLLASGDKTERKFVGIVLKVGNYDYYAPLSSPKPKHLHMRNQIDFLKINNGKWGVINFNNMIPINPNNVHRINVNELPTDSIQEKKYKSLLRNQLSWCNKNKKIILNRAKNLYNAITKGTKNEGLAKRCCDFLLDEVLCDAYNKRLLERKTMNMPENRQERNRGFDIEM